MPNITKQHRKRSQQQGYTLMEMLLVLSIILVLGAVAAPALNNSIRRQRLRSAARQVQTEWLRAHVRAMKTGQIQVFRFQSGSGEFKVESWKVQGTADENAEVEMAMASAADLGTESVVEEGVEQGPTLPEKIVFVGGDAVSDNRSAEVESAAAGMAAGGDDWSKPILFYPDGTASDAFLVVGDDSQTGIRVNLRGLTGLATMSDPQPLDESGAE